MVSVYVYERLPNVFHNSCTILHLPINVYIFFFEINLTQTMGEG